MGKSLKHAIKVNAPLPKKGDSDQSEKFRKLAQELGCDGDEANFRANLKKVSVAETRPLDKKK